MTMLVIWHIHFACWMTKATDTCLVHVICIAFHGSNGFVNTPQCYIHCLSFWFLLLCIILTA